mmetsp:Transcript_37247/g.52606  ORF Transcript_37247/g.52606 Transcript_37247/m.52606 type:complete len:85 (+) Transcript_37247:287-541(+)
MHLYRYSTILQVRLPRCWKGICCNIELMILNPNRLYQFIQYDSYYVIFIDNHFPHDIAGNADGAIVRREDLLVMVLYLLFLICH